MTDGTVRCWGGNQEGQLGNGTRTAGLVPQTVPDLSGVVAVSAGSVHTCVLTDAGAVKCWGYNAYGQVGNGTNGQTPGGDVLSPADVVGLSSGASALAAGGYHTCAIRSDATAVCWGQNIAGELGDGTTSNSSVPVTVSAPAAAFTSLEPGFYHTCAITSAGGTMCWGDGDAGSLGNGASTDSSVPVAVAGASSGTVSISSGRAHSCRVDASGRTTCWGWNLYGQVGNGTTAPSVPSPVAVAWFHAGFTVSCSGLACTFGDASSDPDGEIVGRTWTLGDGGTASGTTASRTYAAGGTYTVLLTARDAAGATSTSTLNVTVTPWNLRASVSKDRNVSTVSLTWNAAATSASTIDVSLNGAFVVRVPNSGSFARTAAKGTWTYQVCPTGDARCSNQVTVKI
jgi:alpha-tubulin suppressor-like RCC1 family protein